MAIHRPRLIYLAGFMGSGKSTVGAQLARALGWPFIDLDATIEAGQGLSVREIFEQAGEAFFRQIERAALTEIIKAEPAVIALGGGTFVQPLNLDLLHERGGATVWLDCPPEELLIRCEGITNRPLFRDAASFEQLLRERLPYYQLADFRVSTAGISPEEAAAEILKLPLF